MEDGLIGSDPVSRALGEENERENVLALLSADKDGTLRVDDRSASEVDKDGSTFFKDSAAKRFGANDAQNPGYSTRKTQYAYLKFVLNPDKEQPVRMPSQLSYPTAVVQYNQNFTLTMPQGDFAAFFAPQNSLLNVSGSLARDYRFVTRITPAAVPIGSAAWSFMQTLPGVYDMTSPGYAGNSFFPYLSTFDSARVIAAVIELTYMGTLVNASGTYIASATILPVNSLQYPSIDNPPTVSQQFNMKIVKKYGGADTVRLTWFPVDNTCMKFISTPGSSQTESSGNYANFSQLIFFLQGYGFQNGATVDVKIRYYYEAIPNLANTPLFAEQKVQCDNWKEQWNELNGIAREGMGQILIQGFRHSN